MKVSGILNNLLIVFLSLLLVVLSFFSIVNRSFKNVPGMLNFFSKAHVYDNLSEIIKLEIVSQFQKQYPENLIQTAVVDTALNYIITPGLIEKIAEPALTVTSEIAKTPTSLIAGKIVIDTTTYKQQISDFINTLGLPPQLNLMVDNVIQTFPQNITLMDEKNSEILTSIIKIRTLLQYNRAALSVSWFLLIVSFVALILLNLKKIKHLFFILILTFIIPALLNLLIFFLAPSFISSLLPNSYDALSLLQNKLVNDAVFYLFDQMKNCAIVYAILSAFCFIIWRFKNLEKLQLWINHSLLRLKKLEQ